MPDGYGRIKPSIVSVCHPICMDVPKMGTFMSFDSAAEFVLGAEDQADIKMLTIVSKTEF